MKYMIISDLHGSFSYAKEALTIFDDEQFDQLLILGDILYHGPRNPLPEGHNPKELASLLNSYKEKIVAIRGNCEAEVDQMMLEFPCLADYGLLVEEGRKFFLTHGHIYNEEKLPCLNKGDVFLYGHTHLWKLEKQNNIFICNPGSISLPKENRPRTFATYENGEITIQTFDRQLLTSIKLMSIE